MQKVLLYYAAVTLLTFLEQLGYQSLFTVPFRHKRRFYLRLIGYHLAAFAVLAVMTDGAIWIVLQMEALDPVGVSYLGILLNLVSLLVVFSMPFICYDEPPVILLYAAIAGKAAQLIGSALYAECMTLLGRGRIYDLFHPGGLSAQADAISILLYILIHTGVIVGCWFLFARQFNRTHKEFGTVLNRFVLTLYLALILVAVFFVGTTDIYSYDLAPVQIASGFVSATFGLTILAMLHFVLLWQKDIKEKVEARTFHENYRKQTELLQENMKLVNIKCHDMRHQIRELGGRYQADEQFVAEVRKAISVYDTTIRTGNEYLDVVLTEKSLRCEANGIQLTAMIDGQALVFLSGADINSFFGNAVDNAIEALLKEPSENRFVRISSIQHSGFLTVRIENYFSGDLVLDGEGFPVTSKDNSGYHGFGVRSMKEVVERYDGAISFEVTHELFVISVIFPV